MVFKGNTYLIHLGVVAHLNVTAVKFYFFILFLVLPLFYFTPITFYPPNTLFHLYLYPPPSLLQSPHCSLNFKINFILETGKGKCRLQHFIL